MEPVQGEEPAAGMAKDAALTRDHVKVNFGDHCGVYGMRMREIWSLKFLGSEGSVLQDPGVLIQRGECEV